MRGKILAILSAAVLVAAVPKPARFDQRQMGTYNFHLNLQDGQVFAVVKDVLVSAPVRNFAVTLKGPIAPPTTELPRTDARTGMHPQPPKGGIPAPNLRTPSVDIPPSLNAPTAETPSYTKTPNVATSSKTPSLEVQPISKGTLTGVSPNLKEPNAEVAAVAVPPPSIQNNGTSNSRRQNNKVASQIINQQTTELVSPPPPPPPVQTAKPTLNPLPPLPSSIIAALTDQRTTNQRIQALPDQVNEISNVKNSYTLV